MAEVKYNYQELIPVAKFANVTINVEIKRDCDDGSEAQTLEIISEVAEEVVKQKRDEVLEDLNDD